MRINRFKTVYIVIKSSLITAFVAANILVLKLKRKLNRKTVDERVLNWSSWVLDVIGVKVKVINPNHSTPIKGKATVIMCNHNSLYDIPITFVAFPDLSIRMLAKKEMSKIPLVSSAMRACEFPFIDRKNRMQAMKDLAHARAIMESGVCMWIAPEGTRSKSGTLLPLKKGAFITAIQSGANIMPICIRGAYDILPAKTYRFNLNQTAEVHVGELIDASTYTLDNKEELIDLVYQKMKELAGEN